MAVQCDVTNAAHVDALAAEAGRRCGGSGVHAVVNNAGISRGHVADLTSVAEYQLVMDVNFTGGVRVTKALLPLVVCMAVGALQSCGREPRCVVRVRLWRATDEGQGSYCEHHVLRWFYCRPWHVSVRWYVTTAAPSTVYPCFHLAFKFERRCVFLCLYVPAASKFAFTAFSDGLRREVAEFGVKVSIIQVCY